MSREFIDRRHIDRCVLFSIKPKWAEAILNGKKHWEYRKNPPGRFEPVYDALLYASSPVQKVVGEIKIVSELRDNIDNVIQITVGDTPHLARDIRQYFGDRREACALEIGKRERLSEPVELEIHPPQNFTYVTKEEILKQDSEPDI